MKYLLLLIFLTGCATTSDPTLEGLMRNSYFTGCRVEAEAMAMSKVELEAVYYRCDAKAKTWNINDDIPQFSDELDIIRRRHPRLDRR